MNIPIENHKLIGQKFIYRPDEPHHDYDKNSEPGQLLIGNGMEYEVVLVFNNWNDVKDLKIVYVFVPETGEHLHLSFKEGSIDESYI